MFAVVSMDVDDRDELTTAATIEVECAALA